MVVYGSLIILEKRVGVAQTVAGLGLHSSILQLPRQLQCPPDKHTDMLVQNHCREASISASGLLYATGFTLSEDAQSGKMFLNCLRKNEKLKLNFKLEA